MINNRTIKAMVVAGTLLMLSFLFFLILQVIAYRIKVFSYLGLNLFFLSILVTFLIFFLGPRVIARFISDEYERNLIATMVAISFLGYINVYNIVFPISLERSFSVRILVNLSEAPNSQLTKAEVEALQPRENIYGLRYKEMSGAGLIDIDEERVKLTGRGQTIASIYVFLAHVIGYSKGFGCAAMEDCVAK